MKLDSRKFRIRFFQFFLLFNLLFLTVACTANWISEAVGIVQVIEACIPSLLAILAAFGVSLAPGVLNTIQQWGAEAQTDLLELKSLIEQYKAAEATAQPGILAEIQALVGVINTNMQAILPMLHVDNAALQAKIEAIFNLVATKLVALANLIPVIEGKVADHDEIKKLLNKLQSAKAFKKSYNGEAAEFGPQYIV